MSAHSWVCEGRLQAEQRECGRGGGYKQSKGSAVTRVIGGRLPQGVRNQVLLKTSSFSIKFTIN